MLALLSLLDLVYMLRSTLAATLLKIIALPVPLLRQVRQRLLMQKYLSYNWTPFFEPSLRKEEPVLRLRVQVLPRLQ